MDDEEDLEEELSNASFTGAAIRDALWFVTKVGAFVGAIVLLSIPFFKKAADSFEESLESHYDITPKEEVRKEVSPEEIANKTKKAEQDLAAEKQELAKPKTPAQQLLEEGSGKIKPAGVKESQDERKQPNFRR